MNQDQCDSHHLIYQTMYTEDVYKNFFKTLCISALSKQYGRILLLKHGNFIMRNRTVRLEEWGLKTKHFEHMENNAILEMMTWLQGWQMLNYRVSDIRDWPWNTRKVAHTITMRTIFKYHHIKSCMPKKSKRSFLSLILRKICNRELQWLQKD